MNALQKSLQTCVSSAVNDFIDQLVAAKLVSDKEKAVAVWNATGEELKIVEVPPAKKAAAPKKKDAAPKKKDDDSKKCQYVYVKGEREGESCGAKVSDESDSGSFCKKHLAHEKKGEEKKAAPAKKEKTSTSAAPKKTGGKKKADAKEAEAEAVAALKDSAPVFSVKMNKYKNYEHEPTGLLFDRKTEEVYGRQKSDGQVAQLTIDDLETCKCLGFKFRIPERLLYREEKADGDEEEEEEIVDSDEEDEEEEDD